MKSSFVWGAVIALLLSMNLCYAVGLAINPGSVTFGNMLRGGYAERTFRVSTSSSEPILIRVERDTLLPEINPWITLEPDIEYFNISSGRTQEFKLILQPPADVPNGQYSTYLHFATIPNVDTEGRTVAVIQTAVAMRIVASISDFEIASCKVFNSGISSAEKGNPVRMGFDFFNSGNVVNSPEFKVDIWDQSQTRIVKSLNLQPYNVLPTVRESLPIEIPTDDLDADQYFAEMTVPACENYRKIETFDVFEPGTISASGKLLHIKNDAWHYVGDTVELIPVFINDGEKSVSAQFKGYVFRDDKLVEVLESDTLEVSEGQQIDFPFFYVPEDPGRYVVKGRVFYDKKRTFEIESRFNVNPDNARPENAVSGQVVTDIDRGRRPSPFYFIAIVGIIGALVLMIQRKKSRMQYQPPYQ
jgi:ribosomal protein L19